MAAFIMNITTGMVNIIMNRYLENNGGDYAIGAFGIISSYSIQVSMLLMGICQGMQSVIGYFYAAGHRQMTLHILRKAIRTGSLIACCGFIIGEAFAPWLVKAFTSDPTLLQLSEEGLRYTFLAMPLLGFQLIVTSYFQSIRQAPKAITMNISRQFLFLIPALGLFSHWWGLTGIWLAIPFADLMATLIALFFLWRTNGKRINGSVRIHSFPPPLPKPDRRLRTPYRHPDFLTRPFPVPHPLRHICVCPGFRNPRILFPLKGESSVTTNCFRHTSLCVRSESIGGKVMDCSLFPKSVQLLVTTDTAPGLVETSVLYHRNIDTTLSPENSDDHHPEATSQSQIGQRISGPQRFGRNYKIGHM